MKSKNNQPDQFWKLPFGKPLSFSILECTVLENHHQVLQPKMLQEIVLQPYIKKPDTIMSHITLEIFFSKKKLHICKVIVQSNRRSWLDHRNCHYLVEMVIYRACSLQIAKHSIINNANIFLSAVFIEVLLESLQNNKSSEWGRITRHELYNILLITKYGSQETKQSIAYCLILYSTGKILVMILENEIIEL